MLSVISRQLFQTLKKSHFFQIAIRLQGLGIGDDLLKSENFRL